MGQYIMARVHIDKPSFPLCKCMVEADESCFTLLQHLEVLLGDKYLAAACDAAYHLQKDTTAMQQLRTAGEYRYL